MFYVKSLYAKLDFSEDESEINKITEELKLGMEGYVLMIHLNFDEDSVYDLTKSEYLIKPNYLSKHENIHELEESLNTMKKNLEKGYPLSTDLWNMYLKEVLELVKSYNVSFKDLYIEVLPSGIIELKQREMNSTALAIKSTKTKLKPFHLIPGKLTKEEFDVRHTQIRLLLHALIKLESEELIKSGRCTNKENQCILDIITHNYFRDFELQNKEIYRPKMMELVKGMQADEFKMVLENMYKENLTQYIMTITTDPHEIPSDEYPDVISRILSS